MKTVYTCFCTDVIHEGHLNIIEQAHKYGRVVVGALSDEALIKYNKFPTISLEERIKLYESLDGVDEVIVQDSVMYDEVLEKDLGFMLYDMDYSNLDEIQPMFFRAVMRKGVLDLRNCEVIR